MDQPVRLSDMLDVEKGEVLTDLPEEEVSSIESRARFAAPLVQKVRFLHSFTTF